MWKQPNWFKWIDRSLLYILIRFVNYYTIVVEGNEKFCSGKLKNLLRRIYGVIVHAGTTVAVSFKNRRYMSC